MNGIVVGVYVCPEAGDPMQEVFEVEAIAGEGLSGDRYASGNGSYNKGRQGKRQVTLINAIFFADSGFDYDESRRNIVIQGVELMWLIDKEFQVGDAILRGIKYCDPCERPNTLSKNPKSFKEAFFDRGGIIAEVIESGIIRRGDGVIPPKKYY